MARRKELRFLTFEILEGTGGTGAVNESSPGDTDTTIGVDTLDLNDDRTIVPVGARFTTAGISTVRTVTATQNSQQWTVTIDATGGTFTLTLNGETTTALDFDDDSATIQAALVALASVSSGDVTVTGDGPHTITLAGDLANSSGNTLTSDPALLTGGTGTAAVVEVQDGTTTWELTFTPALASGSLPTDDDVITFYPRKIEAKIGEGNIEHTKNKDPQVDTDRGNLDGARRGNEQPMDVSFAFVYDWLRSSTPNTPTVDEALEQEGEAADWLTAAADPCEPYQVTLKVIDSPDCGSEQAEIIIFPYFLPQNINASVEAASVSVSGICVATKPIVRRVANNSDTIEVTNS